jgi:hypothetical protein
MEIEYRAPRPPLPEKIEMSAYDFPQKIEYIAALAESLTWPRYKLSSEGYPGMPFTKSEMIELRPNNEGVFISKLYNHRICGYIYSQSFFEAFPSLFKPVIWWEYRRPCEMPKYVSYKGYIVLVLQWTISYDRESGGRWEAQTKERGWIFASYLYPSTEAEYIAYQNRIIL